MLGFRAGHLPTEVGASAVVVSNGHEAVDRDSKGSECELSFANNLAARLDHYCEQIGIL